MTKTILTTSRANSGSTGVVTSGTNLHYRVGNACLQENITQIRCEITWREPGVFSKLYVRVIANTTTGDSTVFLRVNSVTVNNIVTISAGFVGVVEDTTHTDTVAAGDEVVYRVVPGAGGAITIGIISIIFDPTDTSICSTKQVQHGYAPVASSATQYANISGRLSGITSVEANTEATIRKAGILKNAFMYVSGNARTTTTTWTLRKNRTDTAIVLSYSGGEIGMKEDTTNTVSVAVDDQVDWKVTTGSGTETLSFFSLSLDYVTTTGDGFINCNNVGASGDITVSPSVTEYYVVGGGTIEATTTEADAKLKTRQRFMLSGLTVNARTNTITADSTLRLRKNGANANQFVTIGNAATGVFTSTESDIFEATDEMDFQLITGGTGTTLTIQQIGIYANPVNKPIKLLSDSTTITQVSMVRAKAAPRTSGAETITISETRNRINGAVRAMAAQTVTIAEDLDMLAEAAPTLIAKAITDTALTISEAMGRLKAVWRLQP
jgi:hypothetical protein